MAAKLVAEEGVQKGLVLSLDEGQEWVIGRDPDACQLLIEDPSASRKHLVCRKSPEGITVQNLSTTNPISVNEEVVAEPRLLRNGDLVKIGEGSYRYYAESEAKVLDKGEISQTEPNGNHFLITNPNPSGPIISENNENLNHAEVSQESPLEENSSNKADSAMTNNQATDNLSQTEDDLPENPDSLASENASDGQTETSDPLPPAEEETISSSESTETPDEKKALPSEVPVNEETPDTDPLEDEDHISIFEDPFEEGKSQFPTINFDLSETGRWLLKVVGGPNQGAEFSMQPNSTYLIGTDPNSCDIVFHDTSVSRQHAKITVNDDDTILLEDLKSRNGTFIDGKQLSGKDIVPANTLVTIGTSSFVVYDREGAMQTIISPLLPSIVKVLKNAEDAKPATDEPAIEPQELKVEEPVAPIAPPVKKPAASHDALGAFILISIITGLFVVIGIGTTTLFKSQPIVSEQVIHPDRDFTQALSAFPSIKYSFNRSTGRLLLVGHVLTSSDKNQLLYNLQGINYIRNIDDSGVIIDEGVWREINTILSQNQNWKGISIQSPTPGHFVISGFLKTRKQAEQLWDYISSNFPYLDLLERRVIVEEDVVTSIGSQLQNVGFKDVSVQMNEGDVILTGHIPAGKLPEFNKIITGIKEIPGVRNLKNFVTELAPEQSMINITDKYDVSGVSREGTASTSVVINGRILTRGDILDGMTITSIKSNAIFLEKDGIKYRIDYSR